MKKGIIFLLLFIFGLSLVSAGFAQDLIGGLNLSEKDLVVIKYVLTGLIILVVFLVLNSIGIPENKFFQLIFSVAVGVLATLFISPEEIWAILQVYVSLVLAIFTAIILIILYFIYRFFKGKPRDEF